MMTTAQRESETLRDLATSYMDWAFKAKDDPRFQNEVPWYVMKAREANHLSIRAAKRTHCHLCLHTCIEPGDTYCMNCGTAVIH